MFDRSQSRIIIILGLLGVFGCVFSLSFLSGFSALDFKFPLEKDKVLNIADEFLNFQGILSPALVKKAKVLSSQQGIIYLQKTLGIETTNKLLESLPLYYWQIDYFYRGDRKIILPLGKLKHPNRIRILIHPINGNIIGFSRLIPLDEYKYQRILSKNELEAIANNFFSSIEFDISDFRMMRYSPIERKYIFEWEKNNPEFKITKLKVKLEIFGDRVGNFHYFLDIPAKEFEKFKSNNIFGLALFIILNALVFALGVFALIISIVKRKKLEWRFGIVFALLMLISFLINFLKVGYYKGSYLVLFLFVSILTCVINFFWTIIVSCVSKLFAKESNLNMFPVKISSSILLSYIFFFSGLGFTMFFFIFVIKILKPITILGFDSFFSEFPSSKLSCLIAPFLSLSAAVFEEIFFRALMISFLNKYLKKTIWAIIISSLIWSFIHVSPIGYSDIYPGFIKGIILLPIGILLGYIFVRFGLICAIVTHYFHDLVVIGAAFLEFNNFRNVNENVITMLIAAILPLVIAFYFKLKESNA